MTSLAKRAVLSAAMGACLTLGMASSAYAGTNDYEFELATPEVAVGKGSEFAVRLIHKPDNKPVTDAVIFATRLDMGPDGMEDMTPAVTAVQASEPGVYRFKANISMAGRWAFSVAAKVQGESETVQSKLVFQARP